MFFEKQKKCPLGTVLVPQFKPFCTCFFTPWCNQNLVISSNDKSIPYNSINYFVTPKATCNPFFLGSDEFSFIFSAYCETLLLHSFSRNVLKIELAWLCPKVRIPSPQKTFFGHFWSTFFNSKLPFTCASIRYFQHTHIILPGKFTSIRDCRPS